MTLTCPGCGRAAPEGTRECPYCGTPLGASGRSLERGVASGDAPPRAAAQPSGRAEGPVGGGPGSGANPAGAGQPYAGQYPDGGHEAQYAGQYPDGGHETQYAGQYPDGGYEAQYAGQYPWQYEGQGAYPAQGPIHWYQSCQPYGYMMPMPGPWWCPYAFTYAPYFFSPMMHPGMIQPFPAQQPGLYPQAVQGRRRMHPLVIALIIIGVLAAVGGAVAAALLMTGSTSASYRLGDGRVAGADIEFRDMTVSQEEETITLTGRYDNRTKYTGEVTVTIQAISGGEEQLMAFAVPVSTGTNRTFSRHRQAGSMKLKGATLGSLVFRESDRSGTDLRNLYPDESQQTQPSGGQSTSPGQSAPDLQQYNQDIYDQFPYYEPDSSPGNGS